MLVAADSAAGAVKSIWGPLVLPNGRSAFPVYRDLGVQDLQYQLSWRATATRRAQHPRDPRDPAYHWPVAVTQAVRLAHRNGMSASLMLIETPAWANGARSHAWAPTRAKDFADFAAAASRHYPSVRRWMIWGEPVR